MSENGPNPTTERRKYVSQRGPFKLNANPEFAVPDTQSPIDEDAIAARFEYGALAEKYGEEAARKKIVEMTDAYRGGATSTMLFSQEGENGMSLAHIWFGPNFELFRHSHPAHGDCLYIVIAGEIAMGSRKLGPGSTLFIPIGQPYKYTSGPAGVELLEFRAGGGVSGVKDIFIDERSLDAIDKLIDGYRENRPKWQAPRKFGEVAFMARERESGSK